MSTPHRAVGTLATTFAIWASGTIIMVASAMGISVGVGNRMGLGLGLEQDNLFCLGSVVFTAATASSLSAKACACAKCWLTMTPI